MANSVYFLCTMFSAACSYLLFRNYHDTRTTFVFWGALCFLGLTVNNLFVIADLVIFPDVEMTAFRSGTLLLSVGVLIFGFIREAK